MKLSLTRFAKRKPIVCWAAGVIVLALTSTAAFPRHFEPANPADELSQADLALKRQQFRLAEREQRNHDILAEAARSQSLSTRWSNPLMLAVIAAFVAAMGNAVVAVVNGVLNRRLEDRKASSEASLARLKAESDRLLEVVKTGDTERAAQNLQFLLNMGLVADASVADPLRRYLVEREPGTGLALPAPTGQFQVDDASTMSSPLKSELVDRLGAFAGYLRSLGLGDGETPLHVKTERNLRNAYYASAEKTIWLDEVVVTDAHMALIAYTQYALQSELRDNTQLQSPAWIVYTALEDYFAASYLNDSKVSKVFAEVHLKRPYVRDLENQINFSEIVSGARVEQHHAGEVWSGALWAVRKELGQATTDLIVAKAWKSVVKTGALDHCAQRSFYHAVLTALDETVPPAKGVQARNLFLTRGFAAIEKYVDNRNDDDAVYA